MQYKHRVQSQTRCFFTVFELTFLLLLLLKPLGSPDKQKVRSQHRVQVGFVAGRVARVVGCHPA